MRSPSDLASRPCEPCSKGASPLVGEAMARLLQQLDGKWSVVNEHHLRKDYTFRDFREALDFTNRVGAVAEAQGHHPDLFLSWGRVRVELWTHAADGLTESDFILAAKIDAAF